MSLQVGSLDQQHQHPLGAVRNTGLQTRQWGRGHTPGFNKPPGGSEAPGRLRAVLGKGLGRGLQPPALQLPPRVGTELGEEGKAGAKIDMRQLKKMKADREEEHRERNTG